MANEEQEGTGPGTQPVGLNEGARDGGASTQGDGQTEQPMGGHSGGSGDGQTEQVSSGQVGGSDNVRQDANNSEGEPGRSQSDSTGGQTESQNSDVPDPAMSDSRV